MQIPDCTTHNSMLFMIRKDLSIDRGLLAASSHELERHVWASIWPLTSYRGRPRVSPPHFRLIKVLPVKFGRAVLERYVYLFVS